MNFGKQCQSTITTVGFAVKLERHSSLAAQPTPLWKSPRQQLYVRKLLPESSNILRMMGRKKNTKLEAAAQSVLVLIAKGIRKLTEEEENAKDFCEELRSLVDVHEVRGCHRKRMGQALIGCGMSTLNESTDDKEKVKAMAREMVKAWSEIIDED